MCCHNEVSPATTPFLNLTKSERLVMVSQPPCQAMEKYSTFTKKFKPQKNERVSHPSMDGTYHAVKKNWRITNVHHPKLTLQWICLHYSQYFGNILKVHLNSRTHQSFLDYWVFMHTHFHRVSWRNDMHKGLLSAKSNNPTIMHNSGTKQSFLLKHIRASLMIIQQANI